MSNSEEKKRADDSEPKSTETEVPESTTPTDADHYVYESIIAEIGY